VPDLSIGELDTLVFKAYRGAGFSWGMAQEAGRAASWLALNGLPAGSYFDALLHQIDGVAAAQLTPAVVISGNSIDWQNSAQALCPVICGSVISDLGASLTTDDSSMLFSGNLYSPGILLPFVADIARDCGENLQIKIDGQSVGISSEGRLETTDFSIPQICKVNISVVETSRQIPISSPGYRRIFVSDTSLNYLGTLAHRTYVPASEQSRESGAGAGLTDND